jgi:hypothetical protein
MAPPHGAAHVAAVLWQIVVIAAQEGLAIRQRLRSTDTPGTPMWAASEWNGCVR